MLRRFATRLLQSAGLPGNRALVVANTLLEADLLGYSTHGLQRLPTNLEWIEQGRTRCDGNPHVLVDTGNVFNWDAEFLPGPWVVNLALDTALESVKKHKVVTGTIRRSQHVACLAAYLRRLTDKGLMIIISASTPSENTVSPFGGITPIFSANPVAVGIPGKRTPILIDISMCITAEGYITRAFKEGSKLPTKALKNSHGDPSDDPMDLYSTPGGSIMPIGGLDHGYKGYALCILTEVLTMALAGYGRANAGHDGEANSVFIQLMDPTAFCSMQDFLSQIQKLRDMCRTSEVKQGDEPVRIPGERAIRKLRHQLENGVELRQSIISEISPWAEKLGVALPLPME
jgi:L-lactate dehydrogenase